jgi:hypothetical protein
VTWKVLLQMTASTTTVLAGLHQHDAGVTVTVHLIPRLLRFVQPRAWGLSALNVN